MKLISDIINELMDYGTPISGPLLKTKVFAARSHNQALLDWVNGELNGYNEETVLPEYRTTSGTLSGNYVNRSWQYSNATIPISHLSDEERENLLEIVMRDSVSAIEKLTTQTGITVSVGSHQKAYLEHTLRNIGNHTFQILNLHLNIPAPFLTNILAIVRSKLLDFMLEVENQFGHHTEIEDLKSKKALLTKIMNTTINSTGDGVVITTGSKNEINANISIYKGDKTQLKKTLEDQFVEQADIQELLTVIDQEPPTAVDKYSGPVNIWIKKMLNKTLDGSWQVGIGAAGGVLGDAIARYYGLK